MVSDFFSLSDILKWAYEMGKYTPATSYIGMYTLTYSDLHCLRL